MEILYSNPMSVRGKNLTAFQETINSQQRIDKSFKSFIYFLIYRNLFSIAIDKLSTEMSVKTKQLFQKYEKFLEWLKIGNYRELFRKHRRRKFRTFLEWISRKIRSRYKKYSSFTIELRQVLLAMKVFQAKNVSFLLKITIISRWEPTSQTSCCCRFKGGKLDLSTRLTQRNPVKTVNHCF